MKRHESFFAGNNDYYKRPVEVRKASDVRFAKAASVTADEINYLFRGQTSYAIETQGVIVSSDFILDETRFPTPFHVLDVGAGDFRFTEVNQEKYGDNILFYGIAANDAFRPENERKQNEYQRLANAEYLSEEYGKNKFAFIFSRTTYMHFSDPIGAIQDAYKVLADNGYLLIDQFSLPEGEEFALYLINFLKAKGYEVTGDVIGNTINNFIIHKTPKKPKFKFPLLFKEINEENRVVYTPNNKFNTYCAFQVIEDSILHKMEKNFIQGMDVVLTRVNKINSALLKECHNLFDLFSHEAYLNLSTTDQSYFILAVVAKYNDFSLLNAILDKHLTNNAENDKGILKVLYREIVTLPALSTMINFSHHQYFKLYGTTTAEKSSEQPWQLQAELLMLAAFEDLIKIGKQQDVVATLQNMQLPYQLPHLCFDMNQGRGELTFKEITTAHRSQLRL